MITTILLFCAPIIPVCYVAHLHRIGRITRKTFLATAAALIAAPVIYTTINRPSADSATGHITSRLMARPITEQARLRAAAVISAEDPAASHPEVATQDCYKAAGGMIACPHFDKPDAFLRYDFKLSKPVKNAVVTALYATEQDTTTITMSLDGVDSPALRLQNTANWWNFSTVQHGFSVDLSSGHHQLIVRGGGWVNLDVFYLCGDSESTTPFYEAENLLLPSAGATIDTQKSPEAHGGRILCPRFSPPQPIDISFRFTTPRPISGAHLVISYGTESNKASADVSLDGAPLGRHKLKRTPGWWAFRQISIPVGDVTAGPHVLTLRGNEQNAVNIDGFYLAPPPPVLQ